MNKLINVLLIDDDPNSNFIASKILEKLNIAKNIKIATNGHDGLDFILKKNPTCDFKCPELIILDRKMPIMDAEEFIEALNNLAFVNRKDMVIMLISSSLSDKNIETFRKLGVEEFALKPLAVSRILEVYNKYFQATVGSVQAI